MKVHLVDGTYELFRAHFSKRPPRPNKAIVGLVESLLALANDADEQLTHVAVAFDNPIRSFRNDLFDGYKTEEGVDPELLAQFDGAERATRALGMTVWSMKEFEADDALATGAARFADAVDEVRILSPDKDLGQCLRGTKVVQIDRVRRKHIDEHALMTLRGIKPASIPDWLALVGDVADGVPGLPGFGEKSAAALLAAFDHLEAIPRSPQTWPSTVRGAMRLSATLEAQRDDALFYRTLTRLRTDVPLTESLDELAWRGVPPGFADWCDELNVPHLRQHMKP